MSTMAMLRRVLVANFGVAYSLSISRIEPLSNLYRLTTCWSVKLSKEHVRSKKVRCSLLGTTNNAAIFVVAILFRGWLKLF